MDDLIAAFIAIFLYILGFFTKPLIDRFIDWQAKRKTAKKKTLQTEGAPRLIIPFSATERIMQERTEIEEPVINEEIEIQKTEPQKDNNPLGVGVWCGWCMKCKKKQKIQDARIVTLQRGMKSVQGHCPICGTKMSRILKKNQ